MYQEINVPQNRWVNIKSKKKVVRLKSNKNILSFKESIDKHIKFYKNNTERLYFHLESIQDLKRMDSLRYQRLNILIDFQDDTLAFLNMYPNILSKFYVKVDVEKIDYSKLHELLNVLEKYDVIINFSLNTIKEFTANEWELLKEKEHILKKISPLYDMAYYNFQKKNHQTFSHTLWSFYKEEQDKYLYFTEDNISLSKRLKDQNQFFAKRYKDINKSTLYQVLDEYEQNTFLNSMECAMCDHYEYCKALLKFNDPAYDCSHFVKTLNEMNTLLETQ